MRMHVYAYVCICMCVYMGMVHIITPLEIRKLLKFHCSLERL